ncbi:protocadherin gamma-C4-like [Crassostrea angulata]|uniref:protocadherin gamma-C4-like n=1 Tax=Magallana angulata TaxID=2784310 RepID=UPI0022B1B26C|nr:protocadherin gamma-C4-like [Crassostrea angulata]
MKIQLFSFFLCQGLPFLIVATPPIFRGLPTSVNVGEQEYANRLIYTLTVSDVNNDNYVCNAAGTTPTPARAETEFRVLIDPQTGHYGVYAHNGSPGTSAAPNVMFDFAAQSTYQINIRCTDSNGEFREDKLEVDVIPGDRLEFTHSSDVVSVDAQTATASELIYTVSSRDLLNHSPLTYTLISVPSTNSFAIDSSSGQVRTTRTLLDETHTPVHLYISVTDGLISVQTLLSVDILNLNSQPNITNLPASVSVDEDIAGGTVIFTLTSQDLDPTDPLTHSFSVSPITAQGLFSFDSASGQFKLSATGKLDYETLSRYNVTFMISDGKTTTGPYSLTINVLNVNEECYFDRQVYYISVLEGKAGSQTINPNFVVRDYDGIQPYSLSLMNGNNSERFTIDSTSGVMTYAVDYDVDQNAMPSTVQMTVQCRDSLAKTGTALIVLTIRDANDNPPTFSQGTYTFYADQFTGFGNAIGQMTVSDKDSGSNADFSCGGSLANSASQTNTYYTVGTGCGVYFLSRTGLSYGTAIRYLVTATDKGSPPLSSTTTVNMIYIETTTTTPSTTTTTLPPSTGLDAGAVAAIVLGSLIGAFLLGTLLYFFLRLCYTGACGGSAPCDFMNCCRNRRPTMEKDPRIRVQSSKAEEMDYWKNEKGGHTKEIDTRYGRRDYPDFPRATGSQMDRISPSNIPVEFGSRGRIYPITGHRLPISYY